MSIYRGAGGAGDAVADSSSEALLVRELALEVQVDADAAAASATDASTSASSAATSATNAANSATAAASSATSASNSASTATTKASEASTSATNAANSATAAQTAETNAETAETNAETAETNAASSASAATTQATNASNSATSASTSATNASTSASAAATSATNAASSATAASGSASTATTQASNASTSASNAAASSTSAAGSATTATTQAGIATTKASEAATSASNAASSASAASTSASNAATSETNAASSASTASSAASAALASLDSFDDRYLGAKSSEPTLDNDGNALASGALYFNTVSNTMKVYTGSAWVDAYADGAMFLTKENPSYTGTLTGGTGVVNLGSGQFYKDASGNVGIGYATPGTFSRFVVQDSGGGAGTITALSSAASNALYIKNTGTEARFSYNDAYPMTFGTGGAERMRIDSSGNLLVGTTSSLYTNAGRGIVEINGSSESWLGLNIGGTTASYFRTTGNDLNIINTKAGSTIFSTSNTEAMRIDSSGNCGIGTSSPATKLQVNGGNVLLTGSYATSQTNQFQVTNGQTISGGTGYGVALQLLSDSGGNYRGAIQNVAGGTAYEVMTFASNNVGIGTSSPISKLMVSTASAGVVVSSLNLQNGTANSVTGQGVRLNLSGCTAAISDIRCAYIQSAQESGQNDHYLAFGTNAPSADPTERMRINSSGTVMINTTTSLGNPKLMIRGGDVQMYLAANTTQSINWWNSANTLINTIKYDDSDGTLTIGSVTGGAYPTKFQIAGTERMRIDSGGNLLVGTTASYSPLTVLGNVTMTGSTGVNSGSNSPMVVYQRKSSGPITTTTATVSSTVTCYNSSWQVGVLVIRCGQQGAYSSSPGGYQATYGIECLSTTPGPRSATIMGSADTFGNAITISFAYNGSNNFTVTATTTDPAVPGAVPNHELWMTLEFHGPTAIIS